MARARPFLFLQIFSFFFSLRFVCLFTGVTARSAPICCPPTYYIIRVTVARRITTEFVACFFFSIARSVAGNELVAKMVTSYVTDTRDEKWNFIGQYVNFPRFLLFVKARLLNLSVGNENLIRNSGRSQGEGG